MPSKSFLSSRCSLSLPPSLPHFLPLSLTVLTRYWSSANEQTFNGKKWEKFNSEKVASLAYARIQGKSALIAHFQNSSLMNEDKRCRPILFHTDGPNAGDQVSQVKSSFFFHLFSNLSLLSLGTLSNGYQYPVKAREAETGDIIVYHGHRGVFQWRGFLGFNQGSRSVDPSFALSLSLSLSPCLSFSL